MKQGGWALEFDHYVVAFVLGTLVVSGAAWPLLAALAVAWWPGRRPRNKLAFVASSAVVVLGTAGLLTLLSLPFELFGTYISPQLEHDGHTVVPSAVGWIYTATSWLPYIVVGLGSLVVPLLARRVLWERICEALANMSLQPIAREDARSG